jgi:propionyl-CoA carboxylase alpha chain
LLAHKIEVAKSLNVDAIHPGYGFLSENADFAEKKQKGITFYRAQIEAIHIMGSKLAAKEAVKPIIYQWSRTEAITDIEKSQRVATEIGFPF